MATVTFNIADADMPRLVAAYSVGWVNGGTETQSQYAKRQIREMIIERVKMYEAQQSSGIEIT